MDPTRFVQRFAAAILIVWSLAMLAAFIKPEYKPDPAISTVMTIAAGGVFGGYGANAITTTVKTARRKRDSDGDD